MGISEKDILLSIKKATEHQLNLQSDEGYWWYTLEANESICAEAIFLMHFMGEVDEAVQAGLARRILSRQRPDGTWALFYGGPPDLSTTIECYWALKLAGVRPRHQDTTMTSGTSAIVMEGSDPLASALSRARDFILTSGGITHARVFTKIHLAQFGLIPWSACPAMPIELMLMPTWATVNVYEFSSWARACIIPLLVVMNKKPVRKLLCHCERSEAIPCEQLNSGDRRALSGLAMTNNGFTLNELFAEPANERSWHYKTDKAFLSWERFFIHLNKFLRLKEYIPNPLEGAALKKCEEWICEHIAKTEDIYPALAYGAMALSALGHPNSHPMIRKALNALRSFQQVYEGDDLPAIASVIPPFVKGGQGGFSIHQQCCISPVWDTPWQITALLEAGVPSDHPALLKSGRWLISKQITKTYGDWKFKNPNIEPGGWSFEFENEFFPDVDDTIQVLYVLNRLVLPEAEKREPIERGLKWLLSMQNDDGGWGAFDKNQILELVNKIPFSDHGACLDPSSPDITGRMLTLLVELNKNECHCEERSDEAIPRTQLNSGDRHASLAMTKALDYLKRTQEPFGAWSGRWGVNYIYGTWCVLTGLANLCHSRESGNLVNTVGTAIPATNPSAGKCGRPQVEGWLPRIQAAADWLISIQHEDGGWSEDPFTYKTQKYAPYPHYPPLQKGGQGGFGVPSQTAWALMGLLAARHVIPAKACHSHPRLNHSGVIPAFAGTSGNLVNAGDSRSRVHGVRPRYQDATMTSDASAMSMKGSDPIDTSISRGIKFLIEHLKENGTWDEKEFTGTGFPNHFYIRYHGYRHFFPLLALGRYYRNNL